MMKKSPPHAQRNEVKNKNKTNKSYQYSVKFPNTSSTSVTNNHKNFQRLRTSEYYRR